MAYEQAEIICPTCGGLGEIQRPTFTKIPEYQWVRCPNQCEQGYVAGYLFTCDVCGETESTEDIDYAEFGRHKLCDKQMIDGALGYGT